MALVKGICKNIEMCEKAENKEIQEIEKSAPFVCENCGKPLTPVNNSGGGGGGKGIPTWVWIVIAAVLLAGGGGGYYYYSSTQTVSPDPVIIEGPTTPPTTESPGTGKPDGEAASVTIQACLDKGTLQDNNNGTGTISTPYGKYEGELKDGKANGNGTFQFFKSCLISKRDGQERTGETGDYLVGQFAGNEVISAKWLNKEKEQKGTVIIGQSGL